MTPLDWFKKEKPLLGLLGSGGGAAGAQHTNCIAIGFLNTLCCSDLYLHI